MTRSDGEADRWEGEEERSVRETDEGLFQFRNFQLLQSIRRGPDDEDTDIPGQAKILREPFALLAAAEFHRVLSQREDFSVKRWTHHIVELSCGKPSGKVLRYHVTNDGIRLDCTPCFGIRRSD